MTATHTKTTNPAPRVPQHPDHPRPISKQVSDLAALLEDVELFHTPHDDPYATVVFRGHKETWPVRSPAFADWLTRGYWAMHKRTLNDRQRLELLDLAGATARFQGAERAVYYRVAYYDSAMWIDMGDDQRRAIKVTAQGW